MRSCGRETWFKGLYLYRPSREADFDAGVGSVVHDA